MLGKLPPQAFLRVSDVLQGRQGNLELSIAIGTHRDSRNRSKPLQDSEISFRHEIVLHAGGSYRIVCSISEIQLGRFSTSRGFGPSAAPTIPSCSIRSIRCAARP